MAFVAGAAIVEGIVEAVGIGAAEAGGAAAAAAAEGAGVAASEAAAVGAAGALPAEGAAGAVADVMEGVAVPENIDQIAEGMGLAGEMEPLPDLGNELNFD